MTGGQAAALLQAGKCHELLGQWSAAVGDYERLLARYPESELAAEAARRVETARSRVAARPAPK
jgi:TolA-binding protein